MGRRKSNARVIVYTKSMSIAITEPILHMVDAPRRIQVARERLYNPSVGKLRAWADPLKGFNGMIGGAY